MLAAFQHKAEDASWKHRSIVREITRSTHYGLMDVILSIVKLRLVVMHEVCEQEWCCAHHGRGCTQNLGSTWQ